VLRAIIIRASRERYAQDDSAAAPALVVRRCHVKRFLVNVRCAEEVKRVIPASCGAGRPKKKSETKTKNQSRAT
jgi:hypothetical protein